ncbi:MAG: hypothetical protein ACYC44_02200, partial [Patescibacteria group bacterium]
ANRNQWARLIRQNNVNRLSRIHKSLYRDMDETIEYLRGLMDVFLLQPPPDHIRSVISEVRRITRLLPVERLELVLDSFRNQVDCLNLIAFALGNHPDELEQSRVIFLNVLEVARNQTERIGDRSNSRSGLIAIMLLIESAARNATQTWTNILRQMHLSGDTGILKDLVELFPPNGVGYRVVPFGLVDDRFKFYSEEQDTLFFPVPDDLVTWFGEQLKQSFDENETREAEFERLCRGMEERMDAYRSIYEDMWLEMMLQPMWGLRDGGLDCVRISIPELRNAGYRLARFVPREPFPNFHVSFVFKRLVGSDREIEMELEPSDLQAVRQVPSEGPYLGDMLLAFVAVRAVWMIVMGVTSRGDGTSQEQGAGGGDGIVRPRFRRLPVGYRASPEARARALETFRREPLPGFTFVRQYERGIAPQSSEPLFSVTDVGP